jgi:hypothetical protein
MSNSCSEGTWPAWAALDGFTAPGMPLVTLVVFPVRIALVVRHLSADGSLSDRAYG